MRQLLATIFLSLALCAPALAGNAAELTVMTHDSFAMSKDVNSARFYLNAALEQDPGHAASRRLLSRLEQLDTGKSV